jgi:flagellar motor component MotA
MAALGGGLVALVLGIIGMITWWGYFAKALLAAIPAMLILGGALAAYLGFEELKDKKNIPEPFDDTNNLKDEISTLKQELNELKKEKE